MADRPVAPKRAEFSEFYPLQTRWNDNDAYGHMNNVVHYALFDTAVNGWLIDRSLLDPLTSPVFGLVVETGCRYFGEMQFPDRVTAGLRVAKLGRSSVRMELGLFRNDDETASAEGFFVHVYVDRQNHLPTDIPDATRRALEGLQSS
ncbi:acyl-CoA thioesterase [Roseobacter sp. GAI101]|uniref:acyl-CoA thioesterase n=1 Tax=Roseobacter sp. (strain GAI101) TaxID=391589 RepID=UPI00018718E8|nr:thioesterase family protein [Roseobacter sp. GAI101]EEB85867.1 thioesterase superfamily protein [Roseobacter sp. GAI101]